MTYDKDAHKEAIKDISRCSMTNELTNTLAAAKADFTTVAASFNRMREELARINASIFQASVDMKHYVAEYTTLNGFDVMTYVAKVMDIPLSDVEDSAAFENIVKKIHDASSPMQRMRLCTKAKEALNESIKSFISKEFKMKERLDRSDGNRAERFVCEKKLTAIELSIKTLEERSVTISRLFSVTKRKMLDFIEKQSEAFEEAKTRDLTEKEMEILKGVM